MSNIGNKKILGKNLAYYLEKSGKTQREVAEVVGVATSTFNDWVKGKKYPRIDKIEIMANYFRIKKSDLIEEKTIENSPKEMAERHFEIIMDEDINEIFDEFRSLDAKKKQIVKDLIHSLADAEA